MVRVGFELRPVDHNETAFNHLIMLPTLLTEVKQVTGMSQFVVVKISSVLQI